MLLLYLVVLFIHEFVKKKGILVFGLRCLSDIIEENEVKCFPLDVTVLGMDVEVLRINGEYAIPLYFERPLVLSE